MKIQSLLPKGEEDLMEGNLLGHKEGSVIMVQTVDRSHMGHLMKMRQQDVVHKDLQVVLQGEDAVAQAIALLHQVKTKEGIQGTRGGGHQHLHLSSPTSSSTDSSIQSRPKRRGHRRSHPAWKRSRHMEKFKEGGKNVTFPFL